MKIKGYYNTIKVHIALSKHGNLWKGLYLAPKRVLLLSQAEEP